MIDYKIMKWAWVLVFLSCQGDSSKLRVLFSLPKKLKEVSGITITSQSDLIWVVEDSGNENVIYGLTFNGKIAQSIVLKDAVNNDWEEITRDNEGNLYVGDFGNNDNIRQDLAIYKVAKDSLALPTAAISNKISFYYPEQTEFPPKKTKKFFDCEAFFEMNGYFYLFTKNRSKGFDGTTFLYKIPNQSGHHAAILVGSFQTCSQYNQCVITAAALSPDKKKMALLGHSNVWLFEDYSDDSFLKGTITQYDLAHFSQKEAITFKDNNTLLIADERTKKVGGFVYEIGLQDLKSK